MRNVFRLHFIIEKRKTCIKKRRSGFIRHFSKKKKRVYKVQLKRTFKEVDAIIYQTEVRGGQINLGPKNVKNFTGEFISVVDWKKIMKRQNIPSTTRSSTEPTTEDLTVTLT